MFLNILRISVSYVLKMFLKEYSSGPSNFSEINARLVEKKRVCHSFCSKMFRNARKYEN